MFSAMEYDFNAYCHGTDILDIWRRDRDGRSKLSIRKAINFLRHLPGESALAQRGIAGDGRWSNGEHLLAAVVDTLGVMDYHNLKMNTKSQISAPKRIPRPEMFYRQDEDVEVQEEREEQAKLLEERKQARLATARKAGAIEVAEQEAVVFEGGD